MPKVLVVDDEANVAKSVMRLLDENKFNVLTASTCQQALEILQNEDNIGVVISDQRMPLMSGTELFTQMLVTHPFVKRIVLTGYTEMEALREAINRGSIYRLLLKPWDDDELIACVEEGMKSYLLEQENERIKQELTKVNSNLERIVTRKTRTLNLNIQSLQRYEKLVEQLPIGIVCLGDDGMVVIANQQFCKDFGFTNALEGSPYSRVLPEAMHSFIEEFEDASHSELHLAGRTLYITRNYLRIHNAIVGKILSIRAVP